MPLSEPVLLGVDAGTEPCDVELLLCERSVSGAETEIARLKLYGITATEVDIAPYLRGFGGTGPLTLTHTEIVEAPNRICFAKVGTVRSGDFAVSDNAMQPLLPSWLSSMTQHRTISRGECDELRLYGVAGTTFNVRMVSDGGDELHLSHTSPSGAALLHVCCDDFAADARTLEVSISADGVELLPVDYTVAPRYGSQVRLAWRSCAGSIERYTFPTVREIARNVVRDRAADASGMLHAVSCTSERVVRVVSGYEGRVVADALSEIASSPKVWLCDGVSPVEVDLLSTSVTVHTFGRPDRVEVDFCSHREVARA